MRRGKPDIKLVAAFGTLLVLYSFFVGEQLFHGIVSNGHHGIVSNGQDPSVSFVTFAFTKSSGGRWDVVVCRRALTLMYSSLVKSQTEFPQLHVFTDVPEILPTTTLSGKQVSITAHVRRIEEICHNSYTGKDSWKSLSRAKLDVVEELVISSGGQVIWVDLDTLVFTDLGVSKYISWVVGYQHGSCKGRITCSAEHVSNGGPFLQIIEPRHDALGDLWSLNLTSISAVRRYEAMHERNELPLPHYDLQGYFSLMLQDGALPAQLLHETLDYNFGFVCSQFAHPTPENVILRVVSGKPSCSPGDLEHVMSRNVGSISFTAPSFQELFLKTERPEFDWLTDEQAATWLNSWFYE